VAVPPFALFVTARNETKWSDEAVSPLPFVCHCEASKKPWQSRLSQFEEVRVLSSILHPKDIKDEIASTVKDTVT